MARLSYFCAPMTSMRIPWSSQETSTGSTISPKGGLILAISQSKLPAATAAALTTNTAAIAAATHGLRTRRGAERGISSFSRFLTCPASPLASTVIRKSASCIFCSSRSNALIFLFLLSIILVGQIARQLLFRSFVSFAQGGGRTPQKAG